MGISYFEFDFTLKGGVNIELVEEHGDWWLSCQFRLWTRHHNTWDIVTVDSNSAWECILCVFFNVGPT